MSVTCVYTYITHHVGARAGQDITILHQQSKCRHTPTRNIASIPLQQLHHISSSPVPHIKGKTGAAPLSSPPHPATIHSCCLQPTAACSTRHKVLEISDTDCHPRAKFINLTLLLLSLPSYISWKAHQDTRVITTTHVHHSFSSSTITACSTRCVIA